MREKHPSWQIQEAKQRLSEVIRKASADGPQMITHRGHPTAWIISDKEYNRIMKQRESIVDFFQRSPHKDIELDIKRRKDLPRAIDL